MSFNYNNVNSGIPTGTIIATLAIIDNPGWIIANGTQRTDSSIYDNLITLGIGSRNAGNFTPPNLNGVFLRGFNTNTYNTITYNGQNIKTYMSDKFVSHSHTATQVSHYHTNNTTNASDLSTTSGQKGIGVEDGHNTNNNSLDSGPNTEINLYNLQDFSLDNATPTITVASSTTGSTETSPFCYGVNWAIKI